MDLQKLSQDPDLGNLVKYPGKVKTFKKNPIWLLE